MQKSQWLIMTNIAIKISAENNHNMIFLHVAQPEKAPTTKGNKKNSDSQEYQKALCQFVQYMISK